MAGRQIVPKPVLAFEADYVSQAIVGIMAVLHALEVDKRIVFRGIEFEKGTRTTDGVGRRRDVGEPAVTVINAISSVWRQALLIALPAKAMFCQLIANHSANHVRGRKRTSVNIDQAGGTGICRCRGGAFIG